LPDDAWPIDGRIVQGVLHSHCKLEKTDTIAPSADDIRCQMETRVPWGIVLATKDHCTDPLWFGDHILDEPLWDANGRHIPRSFIHGVRDCYTIIRAHYWQTRGVRLVEMPRDDDWWSNGDDLYQQGFGAAGWRQIQSHEVLPDDVMLIKFRSRVFNHAGLIRPNGLMLHHLRRRLSACEPIGRWLQMNPIYIRYEA
jgi:cell wall-associated NlpC family hydrolase